MEKASLRRQLLRARQALTVEEWREKSDRICQHIWQSELYRHARTVLAYRSFRQEPDLEPLFSDERSVAPTWGFPRCVDKSLVWHCWSQGSLMQTGAYGILEPHSDWPEVEAETVDLILVPAVACDARGYRLGYGGGFYDRMLSLPIWQAKPTVGIVFEFTYLPELPIESWDRKLTGVCTETGLLMVNG